MMENQDNFVFAMSHIFHLLCDFIDDRFQKWKEFYHTSKSALAIKKLHRE